MIARSLLFSLFATLGIIASAADQTPGGRSASQGQGTLVNDFTAPPLFSFLSWEKRPKVVDGGLQLQAKSCQGGFGYNIKADLAAWLNDTLALTLTIAEGSQAKSLNLMLQDADGTKHQFSFKLDGQAAGQATVLAENGASLAEPGKVEAAGETPGFDAAKVVQMTFTGDWGNVPIDVTLKRLEMVKADEKTLAARAAHREKLAREAEKRRLAEEQREKRKRELLGNAPHPADGPDIRHVAAVAPDVLVLQVQEQQFVPVPQVPYEPEPGDQIKRVGKEKVLVVEDGRVQESLKDVVVVRKEGKKDITLGHLAVNAGRIKPEDKVVGVALTEETVDEPAAYRVSSDDPAWPSAAEPLQVWWKRKPNAYRSMACEANVYLKLPRPLAVGKTYRIEFPGVNYRQASIDYRHDPLSVRSPAVHVSAIGFRPDDPLKRAYLSQWLGTGGALHYGDAVSFVVLDDASGKTAFSGWARLLKPADDQETFKAGRNYAKTDVLGLDFSRLSTPGRYRVCVEGIGCSYPFEIADDVWTRAFQLSMQGLLHHRAGIALGPPFTDYVRPRNMHPADGVKVFASRISEWEGGSQDGIFKALDKNRTDRLLPDAWGAHMDAGDWDRNTRHPEAMWFLVDLYELFPERVGRTKLALPPAEANNAIPDVLDEVLWNLEMYRRLQTPEGRIGGGVESTSHPRPGEASWQESLMLSAYAPDPRASFGYAATAAKLARALGGCDKQLASAYAVSARKAWDWAAAHGEEFLAKTPEKARDKAAGELRHRRNLAAFELWRLSGQQSFHDEFARTTVLSERQPEMAQQLKAVVSYARLPDGQGDEALRAAARHELIRVADTALAFAEGNGFGITTGEPMLPPMGFVGYLSTPEMSIGAVLPHAWRLTGDEEYLAGAIRACLFAAGANPDNRALTTGLGPDAVRFPLHIDSWVTGQRAPKGITVYGPSDPAENYAFDAWAHTWFLKKMTPPSRTWPTHECYWDIYVVPSTNEYTIHQTIIPTAYYWGFLGARE